MYRYLLSMSYIGTPFRGVQRQVSVKKGRLEDPSTIQGQIELALKRLKPVNEPTVFVSSRTDAGVHALHTTMHVDLERQGSKQYEPAYITTFLNKHFGKSSVPIRILKTYLVPKEFNCRYRAVSRTYLYRLTVVNSEELHQSMLSHYIPIQEYGRSLFVCSSQFNVSKLREAADLFVGLHDFRTFMHKSTVVPDKITRKVINEIAVRESKLFYSERYGWPECIETNKLNYKSYDIVIKGVGFLYKQIRRMVPAMIAVAKGVVTLRDVKLMLEIPSHRSWNTKIKTAPPCGLYLSDVAYSQEDMATFKEQLQLD